MRPRRRDFLATAIAVLGGAAAAAQPWSYSGRTGPDAWGGLDPAYGACADGGWQSPIDLAPPLVRTDIEPPRRRWQKLPLRLEHTGTGLRLDATPGSFVEVDGERFELVEVAVRHPSEHAVAGATFPLELQFVHVAEDGRIAALAVLFAAGERHRELDPLLATLPSRPGRVMGGGRLLDPNKLVPDGRRIFRYAGSLTAPPCAETVLWTVYAEPLTVAPEQVAAFARAFPHAARPLQPRGRRFVLSNF